MRRAVDILASLLVLIVLAPLLVIVALITVIASPGNPLYGGWRTGQNGRMFRMWKFRSMVANAARMGPPITGKDDPRVTPFGRFLRKSKLDEIPQFLNVLAGDMSLVGPRPESPYITRLYNERQKQVLSVRPGVTGPVQLKWSDESECIPAGGAGMKFYVEYLVDVKLQADLDYLKQRSALTDARILFKTAVLLVNRLVQSAIAPGTRNKARISVRPG
jgi:lipopolysaccharide/colanic/teichoic acid biosynthesis glycosyltransferase